MSTVIKTKKQRARKTAEPPAWLRTFLEYRYAKPIVFIAIVVLLGLGILLYSLASTTTIKNGLGLCLDNPNGSTTHGHAPVLWNCHGGLNQQWQVGTDRTVRVEGLCLDDPGGSTANGTEPTLWDCHGGTNQQWVSQSNGTLKNVYAGLCMDDPRASTTAGVIPVLWACHGGINQQWSLPGASTIATAVTGVAGKCLDVRYNEHTQGNTVWLWTCNGGPAQKWSLTGDGTVRNQNWCLDTKDGGTAARTLVQLSSCTAASTQQWAPQGNGTIKNAASGLCLDDQWAATPDGNPIWIWPCDGNVAQVWTLGNVPTGGGGGGPVPPPGPPAPPPPPPPAPSGTIRWQDTPSSGVGTRAPLANWENDPWNIYSGNVSVIADAEKGKAISFNLTGGTTHPGNQRVEMVPNMGQLHPGDTIYIGYDLKLNSGIGNANGWQLITQLKSTNEGNPTFEMDVNDGGPGLTIGANQPNGRPNRKIAAGYVPVEKWSRIVIGMHITQGTDSWVTVWQDGRITVPQTSWLSHDTTGENNGTGGLIYNNAGAAYLKMGVYRGEAGWPVNARFANVKIGSTYSIVAQ